MKWGVDPDLPHKWVGFHIYPDKSKAATVLAWSDKTFTITIGDGIDLMGVRISKEDMKRLRDMLNGISLGWDV